MQWAGVCDGTMSGDHWTCGTKSGALVVTADGIDFGTAQATTTTTDATMYGEVTVDGGKSCFVAQRH